MYHTKVHAWEVLSLYTYNQLRVRDKTHPDTSCNTVMGKQRIDLHGRGQVDIYQPHTSKKSFTPTCSSVICTLKYCACMSFNNIQIIAIVRQTATTTAAQINIKPNNFLHFKRYQEAEYT